MHLPTVDLDGTLVFHHVAKQADAEALVYWRAAGNLLVLATEHLVRLVQHAVEMIRISTFIGLDYDYTVCATGTTVIDAAGQMYCTRTPEADQVQVVMRAIGDATQAPVSVLAPALKRDYAPDDSIGLLVDQHVPPDHFTMAPLSQIAGLGVTSMPLHIPDVRTSMVLTSGLEETTDGISYTHSTGSVDIAATGESKGMGLGRSAELSAGQGMEVNEVVAVGDSWNDTSMFGQVDIPCAMVGVPGEVVKAVGGRIIPSVAAFTDALLV